MLHITHSNKLEVLSAALAKTLLESDKHKSLFAPSTILVQSPAMATWLKAEIAHYNGIAANLNFPMPATWLWELFKQIIGADNLPKHSAYEKPAMALSLFSLLQNEELLANSPCQHYLEQASPNMALRYFHLAEKIADVFDQYLMFRPDWIEHWQRHAPEANENPNVQWQMRLWRALHEKIQTINAQQLHRVEITAQLLATNASGELSTIVIEPLFIFGLSSLPSAQIQLIQHIAETIDVYIFQLNPSWHYWSDIVDKKRLSKISITQAEQVKDQPSDPLDLHFDIGNDLLALWGGLGRDFIGELLVNADQQTDLFDQNTGNTLLSQVQHDILTLKNSSREPLDQQTKTSIDNDDHSIQYHLCHSPLREVEVLHDFLLRQFEADPSLQAKDVVVMAPNIGIFHPAIKAIFSNQPTERYLPYHITSDSTGENNPIYTLFFNLLALYQSRFTASHIINLFETPILREAFQLSDSESEQIRTWLHKANFRWAFDGEHKQQWQLPEQNAGTLLAALDRLLLGLCSDESMVHFADIVPMSSIGNEQSECLGKLLELVEFIKSVWRFTQGKHELADWSHFIQTSLLNHFQNRDEEERQAKDRLLDCCLKLTPEALTQSVPGGDQLLVGATVIINYFKSALKLATQSHIQLGAINFSSLLTTRSLPFKIVCLIGMNDSDFPVRLETLSFDLMTQLPPRSGDRSRRSDDQYLFLEALLSARETLYVSYQARSNQDNRERFASILVQELNDYCNLFYQRADKPSDNTITQILHRLQPFNASTAPISDAHNLTSYSTTWLMNNDVSNQSTPPSGNNTNVSKLGSDFSSLDLDDFIDFFMHPARFFMRRHLGIDFYNNISLMEDQENFDFNGLEQYQLQSQLLDNALLKGLNFNDNLFILQQSGVLSKSEYGHLMFNKMAQLPENMLQQLQALGYHQSAAIAVRFQDQYRSIMGFLSHRYHSGLLAYTLSKNHGKALLRLWIQHLFASYNGFDEPSLLVAPNRKPIQLKPIATAQAELELKQLSAIMQNGISTPIPFVTNTAFQVFNATASGKPAAIAFKQYWQGNDFSLGDASDPYWQRCFPDLNVNDTLFLELSDKVFAPLWRYMEQS